MSTVLRICVDSHRYFTEGAFDPIAVVAGLIQTAIYADFGYIVSAIYPHLSARVRQMISMAGKLYVNLH